MPVTSPTRVTRTYRQQLVALAEADGVFTTPDRDTEAVWVITRYEPDRFFLEPNHYLHTGQRLEDDAG